MVHVTVYFPTLLLRSLVSLCLSQVFGCDNPRLKRRSLLMGGGLKVNLTKKTKTTKTNTSQFFRVNKSSTWIPSQLCRRRPRHCKGRFAIRSYRAKGRDGSPWIGSLSLLHTSDQTYQTYFDSETVRKKCIIFWKTQLNRQWLPPTKTSNNMNSMEYPNYIK